MLYTNEQAYQYLGISRRSFYKYLADPAMPLQGQQLSLRVRVFTKEELNYFKAYMQTTEFKEKTRPGRKADPSAKRSRYRNRR